MGSALVVREIFDTISSTTIISPSHTHNRISRQNSILLVERAAGGRRDYRWVVVSFCTSAIDALIYLLDPIGMAPITFFLRRLKDLKIYTTEEAVRREQLDSFAPPPSSFKQNECNTGCWCQSALASTSQYCFRRCARLSHRSSHGPISHYPSKNIVSPLGGSTRCSILWSPRLVLS